MTLNEFHNMIFSSNDKEGYRPIIINVFGNIGDRDNYRIGSNNGGLLFQIGSNYRLSYVLNERFANANVEHFYSADTDVVDVIIEDFQN